MTLFQHSSKKIEKKSHIMHLALACHAEAPEHWVKWALFSRYLRLKVHIVNPDSNLVALNRAYEYWQLIWAFNDDVMIQENEIETREIQLLLRSSWFKPEEALKGDSMAIQNCCRQLARRNVFGLCRWLKVLNWSGKLKRGSDAVDGCRENWETLSWCSTMTRGEPPRKSSSPIRAAEHFRPLHKLRQAESVRKIETGLERGQWLPRNLRNTLLLLEREKKWAASKIVVTDSRREAFSTFA
jgi:hypothetical protein